MSSAAEVVASSPAPSKNEGATSPMIEVQGLRKFYGRFEALKGISFTVGKGEIVGLLGPNGAGKTTTMKILTGFIAATSGSFRVAGFDGFTHNLEVRRRIGYLPENAPLYPDMGIIEYLKFVCEVRRIPRNLRKQRIDRMVEVVGLGSMIQKNIGELSKGFRQRVGLAQAMIHEPPVLVLDEPTSGLDPNQIVEIRGLIKDLGKERTIVLSTHNLPEVQATCGRMIIISDGTKVADGTPEELERQGKENARFLLTLRLGADQELGHAMTELRSLPDVKSVDEATGAPSGASRLAVVANGDKDLGEALFAHARQAGWTLSELRRDVLDLEKIFHKLTQY